MFLYVYDILSLDAYNLDVYSFFFFRKILIVNIQNAMFI